MTMSTYRWHQRFQQQARWTKSIRKYIYDKIGIQHARRVLDVGCGTGILLDELNQISSFSPYGTDINHSSISFAHRFVPDSILSQSDALYLPYRTGSFDISLCHFLLLWVKNPVKVMEEMSRVVQPGGYVLALAEPDYGGRIDFQVELAQIGDWQIESLKDQGANPFIGRELRSLFYIAGLTNVEVGALGGQWNEEQTQEDIELEWEVIISDLIVKNEFMQSANEFKELDLSSRKNYRRILYVPTFYALGIKKS
jgi:ubiquinone/menaquinone biosynthesis C-methylase UbiE